MPWKESDRMSEKLDFIALASQPGRNMSLLCERFGISRKTGYKWLRRWKLQGKEGLAEQSRRPERSPGKTDEETEDAVLTVRREHPTWGGRKIHQRLLNLRHESVPAPSTITAILHRHGCIQDEDSEKHKPFRRWERDKPNDLWQMDFKGHFGLGNGQRCHPLLVQDDHSRYLLCVQACENQVRGTVLDHLRNTFTRYGIPEAMYVDNGPPWGMPQRSARHTRLSVWLMRHEIKVIHGTPKHPQGRGKLERLNRTLNEDVLQQRQFHDSASAQLEFEPWRQGYNHQRPHEALDMDVPSSHYQPSRRSFREYTEPYEYSERFQTRRTNGHGLFSFQGKQYSVSEAFSKETVGICPTTTDDVWEVYYCRFKVGELDQREGRLERHQPVG